MIKWQDETPTARSHDLDVWADPVEAIDHNGANESPNVVLRTRCRDSVLAHIKGHREERGGLLLGFAFHDAKIPSVPRVIDVVDAVAAPSGTGTAVSLSMQADLWDEARRRAAVLDDLNDNTIGLMVVGWYHSHPGLGAFFSGTDRTTQSNFFREPWHLGLVVDPQRNEWAWFRSKDSIEVDPDQVIAG